MIKTTAAAQASSFWSSDERWILPNALPRPSAASATAPAVEPSSHSVLSVCFAPEGTPLLTQPLYREVTPAFN